ncbi:hypothetical protein IMZ11_38790 [Microtetraspora sp. AC03309]|uniref:hypothetical protein n=1 Tax=Microtetraspora sp. AC03309 TaxID=2779376 RepID=UPI001E2C58FD|nr:hypothetical protein [Microtetraspora sp. AC03309]MCC5581566.1 hypothetical protein [Microtetraspora sp. AC03309]
MIVVKALEGLACAGCEAEGELWQDVMTGVIDCHACGGRTVLGGGGDDRDGDSGPAEYESGDRDGEIWGAGRLVMDEHKGEHLALRCAYCGAWDLWTDEAVIECRTCGTSVALDWGAGGAGW